MKNNYVELLNKLINFEIDENENITREERMARMKNFRDTLSYEKYEGLFQEIEEYLLNEKISLLDKDITLTTLLEFIRSYSVLENNINKFPLTIQKLYNNYINFKRLLILFEQVYYSDITRPLDFEEIMYNYFEFLDDPQNELFIHICYSKIEKFNNSILDYLDKTDFNGIKHKENINNPELISLLKERIDSLNQNR